MHYVRALMVGGAIAGLMMLAGGWWSPGAIADTQVLVGEGRLDAPDPDDVAAEDDRLHELVTALTRRARELDAREEAMATREATLRELELAFASATAAAEAADAAASEDCLETADEESGAGENAERSPFDVAAASEPTVGGGLTEIYANMPAAEAAPILGRLDDAVLRTVFGPMEPKKVAAILAAMNRDRAVAFTRTLAADAAKPR